MNHETVCCDCRTPFVPLKNDIIVNEVNDEGMSVRLWCADLWNCPSCGHRMIKGWGQKATGVMFTVCNQRGRLSEWDGSTN
jgi:uncharacterized protein with PIN domain